MKKIISFVLSVAMVLSLMAVPVSAESAVPEKDGEYYLVKSFNDFMYMATEPTAKYKLANDITVGTEETPFTDIFDFAGELDGNGKTITAYIQGNGSVGLFKSQPTAGKSITIKNLTLKGTVKRTDVAATDTSGYSDASIGGFIGYTANHTTIKIDNCVNYATVIGGAAGYLVGGFVGRAWGNAFSVISNSVNYGAVSSGHGNSHVGGIAGMWSGTITECANVGAVSKPDTGSYYAAGIVGMFRKGAIIEKTANFGPVTGAWAAGIVGYVNELDTSNGVKSFTVENSFNAGKITGNATAGGASGIVGTRHNDNAVLLTLTNNYNGGEITANRTAIFVCISGDSTATTTATKQWYVETYGTYARLPQGTFGQINSSNNTLAKLGFDPAIWTWDTSVYKYPYITSVGLPNYDKGTVQNPYKVSTKDDFFAIKNNPTASYVVANDINLGRYEPFTFKGHLKGQVKSDGSYPVLTVDISMPAVVGVGLFANIDGLVKIENIAVAGTILGGGATGGIAGFVGDMAYSGNQTVLSGSYIKNCINRANITSVNNQGSSGNYAGRCSGGIIGMFRQGNSKRNFTITNVVNYGEIYSRASHAGGIVGQMHGTVTYASNYGNIIADNCLGGLLGYGYDNMPIKNSFNAGKVSGNSAMGGLVGRWEHPGGATIIENCYNVGDVELRSTSANQSMDAMIIGEQLGNGAANFAGIYNAGKFDGKFVNKLYGSIKTMGTATNVYALTFDGDSDADETTIGFAGLKNANLGSAFTASTNAYQFPQIVGNTYNKAFDEIMLNEVNMGDYEGKAWDVIITSFDGANDYTASFTADEDVMDGALDFSGVEADGGSIAFAILLHTSKANVALGIVAE